MSRQKVYIKNTNMYKCMANTNEYKYKYVGLIIPFKNIINDELKYGKNKSCSIKSISQ